MSDSRFRPRPRIPGDGCFLCDRRQRIDAYRRLLGRARDRDFDLDAWWPVDPQRDMHWQVELAYYEDAIQADSVLLEEQRAWLAAHPVAAQALASLARLRATLEPLWCWP